MPNFEYQLKLLLNSTTLQITSIKDLANPNQTLQFNKKYAHTKKIHAFISQKLNVTEVPVFNVQINPDNLTHKVYYCEVAVGESVYVSKDYAMMCQPPSFCDSFIINNSGAYSGTVGDFNATGNDLNDNKNCEGKSNYVANKSRSNSYYEEKDNYNKNYSDERNNYNKNFSDERNNYSKNPNEERNNYSKNPNDERKSSNYMDDNYGEELERLSLKEKREEEKYLEKMSNKNEFNSLRKSNYEGSPTRNFSYEKNSPTLGPNVPIFNSPDRLHRNETYIKKTFDQHPNADFKNVSRNNIAHPSNKNNNADPIQNVLDLDPLTNISNLSYIIKDASKINMLYEITFTYDRLLEQKQKGFCEMCMKNPSVMFCLAERASFCSSCDLEIHNNEFTQRHNRYYYLEDKKKFLSCQFHNCIIDYFCVVCNVPLCSMCKIQGNHSMQPFNTHNLVKFLDACDLVKEKMEKENKEIEKMEIEIKENIKVFMCDMDEFKKEIYGVKRSIENEYRNALNELNSIVRKKMQVYSAIFIEKMVVKEKIRRVKKYITDSENGENVRDYKAIVEGKEEMKIERGRIKKEKIILKGYLSLYTDDFGSHGNTVPTSNMNNNMVNNMNNKR